MNRRQALLALTSAFAAGISPSSFAQGKYPERPIRLIVPRPPGGIVDVVARQWSEQVKAPLGTIVIENHGGGGGTIGTSVAARSQPDGYSLLLGSTSDLVLNPLIMAQLSYDPIRDFVPIYNLVLSVPTIVVHPSVPATTLPELVTYARANPGKLSYGSPGAGTMANLCGELFKQLAGLNDITHVPFSTSNGVSDLIAGHITILTTNISSQLLDLQKAGKLRILVVATAHRLASAAGVPNAVDAGFPQLVAESSIGLFAPAKTPRDIVEKIEQTTRSVMSDTGFQTKLMAAGFEPTANSSSESTAKNLSSEIARWNPILTAAGLKRA